MKILFQHDFLSDGMIDLGASSYAGFLDENADGLVDILRINTGVSILAGKLIVEP